MDNIVNPPEKATIFIIIITARLPEGRSLLKIYVFIHYDPAFADDHSNPIQLLKSRE